LRRCDPPGSSSGTIPEKRTADATGLPAGATTLEIHFDRPMARSVMLSGDLTLAGQPAWDEDRRVFSIPVMLAAGVTYRLALNDEDQPDQGFRSEGGEPLVPRVWEFTVEGR
jgi:hypothetical protein